MAAALLAATPFALAAVPLRGIMHEWAANTRTARTMLSGHRPLDSATLRTVLESYVSASGRVAGAVTGQSAEARAFRAGFTRIQGDAQAALADLGRRDRLSADFSRITGDCSACHDRFRN